MNTSAQLHGDSCQNFGLGQRLDHLDLIDIVARAIIHMVHSVYMLSVPSLVLTLSCSRKKSIELYDNLLERLFYRWNLCAAVQIVLVDQKAKQHVPGRRYYNLVLTDSYESFLKADLISYSARYNFNEYYYIVFLRNSSDSRMLSEIHSIFKYCWTHQLIHCSVQVQLRSGELLVYTYFPFTRSHCGGAVPVVINRFNGTAFERPELFPSKLKNMWQCPLRLAVWNVPPYMYLTSNSNTTKIRGGIEGLMILELASRLNFSIEAIIPPDMEQFVGGGKMSGLRMLRENKSDITMGAFRKSRDSNRIASSTNSHYQSKLVLTVNALAYDFSSLEVLLFPFQTGMWLMIILSVAVALLMVAVGNVVNGYRHHFSSYFDVYLMMIGMPAVRDPLRSSGCIMLINWLFYTLLIRTAYQGYLFHLIRTHATHRLPQNLNDLIEGNYTLVMDMDTKYALPNVTSIQSLSKVMLKSTCEASAFVYIEKLRSNRFFAVGGVDFLRHYEQTKLKTCVFKTLPRRLFSVHFTMYLQKHSYLIDKFNSDLGWFGAAGLMMRWSRPTLQYKPVTVMDCFGDKSLVVEDLYMVFVLLGVALFFACLVFLCEIIIFKYNNRNTIISRTSILRFTH